MTGLRAYIIPPACACGYVTHTHSLHCLRFFRLVSTSMATTAQLHSRPAFSPLPASCWRSRRFPLLCARATSHAGTPGRGRRIGERLSLAHPDPFPRASLEAIPFRIPCACPARIPRMQKGPQPEPRSFLLSACDPPFFPCQQLMHPRFRDLCAVLHDDHAAPVPVRSRRQDLALPGKRIVRKHCAFSQPASRPLILAYDRPVIRRHGRESMKQINNRRPRLQAHAPPRRCRSACAPRTSRRSRCTPVRRHARSGTRSSRP